MGVLVAWARGTTYYTLYVHSVVHGAWCVVRGAWCWCGVCTRGVVVRPRVVSTAARATAARDKERDRESLTEGGFQFALFT